MKKSLQKIKADAASSLLIKSVLLAFLLFFSTLSFAQRQTGSNPGFMGKHFIVSGTGYFTGRIFLTSKPTIWLKYGASSEIILAKKFSIAMSYLYGHKTYNDLYSYSDNCYDYNYFNLSSQQLGFGFNIYPSGLAPLGRFFQFKVIYTSNSIDDFFENRILKPNTDPFSCQEYSSKKITHSNWGVTFFFGNKRIFYDWMVVSYGLQLGITSIKNNVDGGTGDLDYDLNQFMIWDNFLTTLVGFKVELGVIW